jgi:hypothetical protein
MPENVVQRRVGLQVEVRLEVAQFFVAANTRREALPIFFLEGINPSIVALPSLRTVVVA